MTDVGDENSPYAKTGVATIPGKVRARKNSTTASSPLAARDRQGVPKHGRGNNSGASVKGTFGQSMRSRRQTAHGFNVADVLQSLASPGPSSSSYTGDHGNSSSNDDNSEAASPSSTVGKYGRQTGGGGSKSKHKRRRTADFSKIHSILDTSASSAATGSDASSADMYEAPSIPSTPADSMVDNDGSLSGLEEENRGGSGNDNNNNQEEQAGARFVLRNANVGDVDREEDTDGDGDGNDTADFSSFMALDDILIAAAAAPATVRGASAGVNKTRESDGGGGEDGATCGENSPGSSWSKRAAAVRSRAPHQSNQKPGRDSEANSRLVAPPLTADVLGGVAAELGVRPAPGPALHKPRTLSRRPRRSIDLDSPLASMDSWKDHAALASEARGNQHQRGSLIPQVHQPRFPQPPSADESHYRRNNRDRRSTVGVRATADRTGGGGGGGDLFGAAVSDIGHDEMDNDDAEREDVTIDLGLAVAELERAVGDDGRGKQGGGRAEISGDGDAGGGGGRFRRRQTAANIAMESLLCEVDSYSATETDRSGMEDEEEWNPAAAASVGGGKNRAPNSAATPKSPSGKRKKKRASSRRLTADFSDVHALCGDDDDDDDDDDTATATTPVTTAAAAAAVACKSLYSSGVMISHGWAADAEDSLVTPVSTASGSGVSGRATADHADVMGVVARSADAAPATATAVAITIGGVSSAVGNAHLASSGRRSSTADHGALMDILDSSFSDIHSPSTVAADANLTPVLPTALPRHARASASVGADNQGNGHERNIRGSIVGTPSSLCAPSIADSTPSPSGGIGQCLADGSALRGEKKLAPLCYDVLGGGGGVIPLRGTSGGVVDEVGGRAGLRPPDRGYLQRRMTCNGGDLYSVMADLDLPSSSGSPDGSPLDTRSVAEGSVADYSPTSSRDADSPRHPTPEEDDMSTNEEHFASPVALAAADSAADMLESPSQREQRRQAGPKSKADGGADGAGISQKHERRLTASPSSYHNLLDRIDLEMPEKTRGGEEDVAVGGSGESGSGDDRRPVDGPFCIGSGFRAEGVDNLEIAESLKRASTDALANSEGTTQSAAGDVSTPSPGSKLPSPPVACRTRSKSPSPGPKKRNNSRRVSCSIVTAGSRGASQNTEDGVNVAPSEASSPDRRESKMTTSTALSPVVKAVSAAVRPPPSSSTRGGQPLKSCLSSRKRARGTSVSGLSCPSSDSSGLALFTASSWSTGGGGAGGSGDAAGPPPATPDNLGRQAAAARLRASPPMSLRANAGDDAAAGSSAAADGIEHVGDFSMEIETPRRVVFGDPMAAEFNHGSPSNRLTPMPSRTARSLYPLEKQREEDTDEDEDTLANSAQLAGWDNVAPTEVVDDFSDFEGFSSTGDDHEDVAVGQSGGQSDGGILMSIGSPSPRSRRRQSLGPKSPLGKSLAAYSQEMARNAAAGADDPTPASAAQPPAATLPHFSPCSMFDSDCEEHTANQLNASINGLSVFRGGVGSAAAAAAALTPTDNHDRSFSIRKRDSLSDSDSSMSLTGNFGSPVMPETPLSAIAELRPASEGLEHGNDGAAAGPPPTMEDDRDLLNDSSELAYTMNGSSIRDSTSSGAGRPSLGSLMDVVSEVDELEELVMSEVQGGPSGREAMDAEGNEDKNINEDEDDIVSPVSSKSKSSVTAVREDAARAASAVGGGGGGIGGRGGHGDGDDDDTENTVELGSLNAGEPVWQSVLAQVQDDNPDGGARLATVTEESEDHHEEASSDTAAEHVDPLTAAAASRTDMRRDSTATVSLPHDMSALMNEEEFDGLSDDGENHRAGIYNSRRDTASSFGDVDMDLDVSFASAAAAAEIPTVPKPSARRRSSISGDVALARGVGDVSKPPAVPGGSRRRASISSGVANAGGMETNARKIRRASVSSGVIVSRVVHKSSTKTAPAVATTTAEKAPVPVRPPGGSRRRASISSGVPISSVMEAARKSRRASVSSGVSDLSSSIPVATAGAEKTSAPVLPATVAVACSTGTVDPTPIESTRQNLEAREENYDSEDDTNEENSTVTTTTQVREESPVSMSTSSTQQEHALPALAATAAATVGGSRPPLFRAVSRPSRASMSSYPTKGPSERAGMTGGVATSGRRSALQAVIGARRRASFAAWPSPYAVAPEDEVERRSSGRRKRASEGGADRAMGVRNMRRRLSHSSSCDDVGDDGDAVPTASFCESSSVSVGSSELKGECNDDNRTQMDVAMGSDESDKGEDAGAQAVLPGQGQSISECGETREEEEDVTTTPLNMTIEDLIAFVAPEMATIDGQAIASAVAPSGGGGPVGGEDMSQMPDVLVRAMAAALDAAAEEMEGTISVVSEEASEVKEAAWQFYTACPVLGEIDRAITRGDASNEGMATQARDMTAQIKSQLKKEWAVWEANVLKRLTAESEKALAEVSRSQREFSERGAELEEMDVHMEKAECAILEAEFRDDVRDRLEKGEKMVAEAKSEASALEAELMELTWLEQNEKEIRATLLEARARREEREKLAAARAGTVSRLLEVEDQAINKEMEALDAKEMLDVQLGLRLWCQPVRLQMDGVVLAFAAPHSPTLRHELIFNLNDSSRVSAKSVATYGDRRSCPPNQAVPAVGDSDSASFRLSQMMFEGDHGLFSARASMGAAVSGLEEVTSVVHIPRTAQRVEWYVGRAYTLLQQVHEIEKKCACTVFASNFGETGVAGATVCVELADWRSHQQLRLRFRVAPSYACFVDEPEVEVDIGSLDANTVKEAMRNARGRNCPMVLEMSKAVQAASELISSN